MNVLKQSGAMAAINQRLQCLRIFCKNGYTVWRLDLSGYGKSGKYEDGWKVTTQHADRDEIMLSKKSVSYRV